MSNGVKIILGSLVVFAAVHFGLSWGEHGVRAMIATYLGGVALILMCWAILISVRPSRWEDMFGGLDKMYLAHKMMGVAILVLILAHFFAIPKLDVTDRLPAEGFAKWVGVPAGPVGMVTMILLILSVVIALNRKIHYQTWLKPHRLMGVLFGLAVFHMLLTPTQLFYGKSVSGMVLFVVGIVGVAAYLYRQFVREKPRHAYSLEAVNTLERATELVLTPTGAAMDHIPGQFAFLRIREKGFDESHPFTISSAPGADKLRFTTKVLGDFTRRIRDDLQPGAAAVIEGPYGRFDMDIPTRAQVWVAGGVGITPYLSAVRAMKPGDDREVLLIICVQETEQALFLDEIKDVFAGQDNKTVLVLQSNEGEFCTSDLIAEKLGGSLADRAFFLCGPRPMVDGLKKGLTKAGVSAADIHNEAFEFR